jgi:hypothetical protein
MSVLQCPSARLPILRGPSIFNAAHVKPRRERALALVLRSLPCKPPVGNQFVLTGMPEAPLPLALARRVVVAWPGFSEQGQTTFVGPGGAVVALAGSSHVKPGTWVVVAFEAAIPDVWWRFVGRAVAIRERSHKLEIRFIRSMGCVDGAFAKEAGARRKSVSRQSAPVVSAFNAP